MRIMQTITLLQLKSSHMQGMIYEFWQVIRFNAINGMKWNIFNVFLAAVFLYEFVEGGVKKVNFFQHALKHNIQHFLV